MHIVITRPQVRDAKLTALIRGDIPNRPCLGHVVLSDVDSCIRNWLASEIDDLPGNYARLTGVVWHLRG